mmetsp:Transcript_34165/g.80430  ORF Transcript_34165/g.80430 Transcript_34165/m.80430 type:complete len:306 (-) Transcript_34165:200-1117(-)
MSSKSSSPSIPAVANAFVTLYNALPTVFVPFTNLNISFSLLSAVVLMIVRLLSEFIMVQLFGWPKGSSFTAAAASSCPSIFHSLILCPGLIVAFWTQKYDVAARIRDQAKPNAWWPDLADALLQFCTGYMIYDTFFSYAYMRWDSEAGAVVPKDDEIIFIGHHFATSFYMISARVIGTGYMSAMICMLLGEITNPMHNLYFIGEAAMKVDCCNGPLAQSLHKINTLVLGVSYFSFRAIIAPPFFAGVTYVLLFTKRGRDNVPLALNLFWNFLIWGVCFGSTSWIIKSYNIVVDFFAEAGQQGAEL